MPATVALHRVVLAKAEGGCGVGRPGIALREMKNPKIWIVLLRADMHSIYTTSPLYPLANNMYQYCTSHRKW